MTCKLRAPHAVPGASLSAEHRRLLSQDLPAGAARRVLSSGSAGEEYVCGSHRQLIALLQPLASPCLASDGAPYSIDRIRPCWWRSIVLSNGCLPAACPEAWRGTQPPEEYAHN